MKVGAGRRSGLRQAHTLAAAAGGKGRVTTATPSFGHPFDRADGGVDAMSTRCLASIGRGRVTWGWAAAVAALRRPQSLGR